MVQNVDQGSKGEDLLFGTDLNDKMIGKAGDDWFYESAGDDLIKGGRGTDTVRLDGSQSDYLFDKNKDGSFTVTNLVTDDTDLLISIEEVDFADDWSGAYDIDDLV